MVKQFFQKMHLKYGNRVVKMMKELFRLQNKLARAENKKIFLLRCRKQRVFPKNRLLKNTCNIKQSVFDRLQNQFIFGIINQEIAEIFQTINKISKFIAQVNQQIKDVISPYYFRNFVTNLKDGYKRKYDFIKAIHITKFNKLLHQFDTQDVILSENNVTRTTTNSNIDSTNWLVNLTDTVIPEKVIKVLSFGEKFCPPTTAKFIPYDQIIASVEGALLENDVSVVDKPRLRNEFVNILTNFKNQTRHKKLLTPLESKFINDVSHTRNFIKDHPEILVTRADKGNTTVLVNRSDYQNKISSMLEDENIYKLMTKDNTRSIERKLNSMITSWQKQKTITEYEAKSLRSYHGVKAKLYGLPKIHKANTPYRPIVSSVGTPLYQLSAFLSRILSKTVGRSSTSIKNSFEFKEKIRNIVLPHNYIILSLDVISLFTNIDSTLALHLIKEQWNQIETNSGTRLKRAQYISAMELVLNNCEFTFNNNTYSQLFGSPMGSPTSPAIADLVMEFVESSVLGTLDFSPAFFFRYVDDIITAIPRDKIESFFQSFNAFDSNIQFTMELENDNKLSFLDLLIVHNADGSLSTDWYHKPTWSGRYLHFDSHLPLAYKRNTVKLLTNKILQLSDPIFHIDNFRLLKNTLRINGYPNSFTNQIINSIIHKNPNDNQLVDSVSSVDNNKTKIVSIPYVRGLHEKISFCLNKHSLRVVGRALNNLGKTIFSHLKDPTDIGDNRNIVYKVTCECDKIYFGQTKQLMSTRFCQHKQDAQKLTLNKVHKDATSALTSHLFESKHNIYLDNVSIVEREVNSSTRRVLEMIHIKRHPNSINKQSDCTFLQNTYNNLL